MNDQISIQVKTIAANIKKVRLNRNYKQNYLAEKLEITQNAYSKIELGYTTLTIEKLLKIAYILEVNVIDLLGIDIQEYNAFYVNNSLRK